MTIEQLFADYGFTVETSHNCLHTGNKMRAFFAPNDDYCETGCYIDTVTGEVEIDVATNCEYLGSADDRASIIAALVLAREDVNAN